MNVRRLPLFAAAALLATAPLGACGSGTAAESAPSPAASTAPRAALSITDPWVKAAESGMTGAFGTLVNGTGKPVTVVSASSPAAARVELHEVVGQGGGGTKMQPKQGGFVIPAGKSHTLAPGGDHIMLMGLKQRVQPGAEVSVTLELDDGTSFTFTAVAKEFTGAKETYDPTHHG